MEGSAIRAGAGGADRPQRLTHLKERVAGSDLVVYDPNRGRMHVLNVTAAFIWRQCDGTRSQEEMIRNLGNEFRLEGREDAERDVRNIVHAFRQEALIDNFASPPSETSSSIDCGTATNRQRTGG